MNGKKALLSCLGALTAIAVVTVFAQAPAGKTGKQPAGTQKAQARQGAATLARIVTCTGVENHEPVGAAKEFPSEVGHVYCFTELEHADGIKGIVDIWYHEGKEMARVKLAVNGSHWRTWSSKTIIPFWTGEWKVVVQDDQGNTLGSTTFKIVPPKEAAPAPEQGAPSGGGK
jgi:hypothetical protein